METNTPVPEVAQRKSIEELLSDEREKNKSLWAAWSQANDAAEPLEKAKLIAATEWSASNRRIELLQKFSEVQKEIAQ